eukprot:TRINITY_DN94644_c0_g1_i1.p1 TRINITY_DN94644_c0_g1~~TRINITY_DN94644_c0_g1_i1.p1  ORF type:complete len:189 (+),score=13.87 TRINITY_DN94644_c0_g1_i1:27-593(+)
MPCFVLTGTPGAGKTTIVTALEKKGENVVHESFMDVYRQTKDQLGGADPFQDPEGLLDKVVELQLKRQAEALKNHDNTDQTTLFFDRSPLCTLALNNFMGREPSDILKQAIQTMKQQDVYSKTVLFVESLGFVPGNEVGKMSLEDSLRFQEVHREVYSSNGYHCVSIPPVPVDERVALVLKQAGCTLD